MTKPHFQKMTKPHFTVEDAALVQLVHLQNQSGTFLRISVLSGGCVGLQYALLPETSMGPTDIVIQKGGATVVIDAVSYPFLEGSRLSYQSDMMRSQFKVIHQNSRRSCGCGTSFSA